MLVLPRRLPIAFPQLVLTEESIQVFDAHANPLTQTFSVKGLRDALRRIPSLPLPSDRLILLPPFGIRLLPYLPHLDQESVDIRSVSMLLRMNQELWGINVLWRALGKLVGLKLRIVGVVGSGHAGRSALYAARRAGARKLRLITRRTPIDTQKLFDVFSLTYSPSLPLQAFLKEVEVLFWCSPAEPDPSWLTWISPSATIVDMRLPPSTTPWPGENVIWGDTVLQAHLEAGREYTMDV